MEMLGGFLFQSCGEEEETSYHFCWRCLVNMLGLQDLSLKLTFCNLKSCLCFVHSFTLVRFISASKRFKWLQLHHGCTFRATSSLSTFCQELKTFLFRSSCQWLTSASRTSFLTLYSVHLLHTRWQCKQHRKRFVHDSVTVIMCMYVYFIIAKMAK